MRRGWTEWMTRGYGPPYCFRFSCHGSCRSSPFSHVIPLASYVHAPSIPFRTRWGMKDRAEWWVTGKERRMNETNRSAPSVLSLRLVTFPGCFHVVYSPPSLVSCRMVVTRDVNVRQEPDDWENTPYIHILFLSLPSLSCHSILERNDEGV